MEALFVIGALALGLVVLALLGGLLYLVSRVVGRVVGERDPFVRFCITTVLLVVVFVVGVFSFAIGEAILTGMR